MFDCATLMLFVMVTCIYCQCQNKPSGRLHFALFATRKERAEGGRQKAWRRTIGLYVDRRRERPARFLQHITPPPTWTEARGTRPLLELSNHTRGRDHKPLPHSLLNIRPNFGWVFKITDCFTAVGSKSGSYTWVRSHVWMLRCAAWEGGVKVFHLYQSKPFLSLCNVIPTLRWVFFLSIPQNISL